MSYDAGIEVVAKGTLALHRNENLFLDPQWFQETVVDVASQLSVSQYPDSLSASLRKELAKVYNTDPDRIYLSNGADGVLADLFLYLRGQYDEVGTPEITYRVYPYLFERYNYRHVYLEERVPALCVVDSPSSITGETHSLAPYADSFLIWDNVYGEFADDKLDFHSLNAPQVIIRSFSKFYGMASLRLGYCFTDPKLVTELDKRKDVFNVNGMAQALGLRLLQQKDLFDSLLPEMWRSKKVLEEGLVSLGFNLSPSKANFLWITHPELSAAVLQQKLLEENVIVRHFAAPKLENHLRITVPKLEQTHQLLDIIRGIYV